MQNVSRRTFLKTLGALAACAIAEPVLGKIEYLFPSEQRRLLALMRTGIVENQTFYFDHPISIEFSNLIIRNCEFIFDYIGTIPAITIKGDNILFDTVHFDTTKCGHIESVLYFPPSASLQRL